MPKETKIYEKDLYAPVKTWFEYKGYEVKSEVNHCDIVAVKDNEVIIAEMKTSFNLELLMQGVDRQKTAGIVYLVIPRPVRAYRNKRWHEVCHLLKRLGLGLLVVTVRDKNIFEEVEPKGVQKEIKVNRSSKRTESLISEFDKRSGDYNIGGSVHKKLVTSYREKVLHIAFLLEKYGEMSIRKLRLFGTDPKKTPYILSKNYYGWFESPERGYYRLTRLGMEELPDYNELKQNYNLEEVEDTEKKSKQKYNLKEVEDTEKKSAVKEAEELINEIDKKLDQLSKTKAKKQTKKKK